MRKLLPIISIVAMLWLPMAAHGKAQSKAPDKKSAPAQSPGAAASAVTIKIPKDSMGKGPAAYGENPKVVKAGTQVTWTNEDSVAHTATEDSGAFDSGFIMPGKSWSRVFDKPGKYPYYCTLHGKQSMSGTVEVR